MSVSYHIKFSNYPSDITRPILHELGYDNIGDITISKHSYNVSNSTLNLQGEAIISYKSNKNHKQLTKHFCRTVSDDVEITIKRTCMKF